MSKTDILKLRNDALALNAQYQAALKLLNDGQSTSDTIREEFARVSSRVEGLLSEGTVSPDGLSQITDDIRANESALYDLLAENDLPIRRVYLNELRKGAYVLAADFAVQIDACNFVRISKGATVQMISEPGGEMQMQIGEVFMAINVQIFPSVGILVVES